MTWGSGTAGVSGAVSAANSLVGTAAGDRGRHGGVTALSNGNYVVASSDWNRRAVGAVTWGSGTAGISGAVSAANSLVGSRCNGTRWVCRPGRGSVTALTNGNYVVGSPNWNNGNAGGR